MFDKQIIDGLGTDTHTVRSTHLYAETFSPPRRTRRNNLQLGLYWYRRQMLC